MNEACRTVSVGKLCGMSVQFTVGLFQFMALLGEKKLTEDGCRCALQCPHPYDTTRHHSDGVSHPIILRHSAPGVQVLKREPSRSSRRSSFETQ